MPSFRRGSTVTSGMKELARDAKSLATELGKVADDAKRLASKGKARYMALDPKTKRQAKAALAGLAALLTAGVAARTVRRRRAVKKTGSAKKK